MAGIEDEMLRKLQDKHGDSQEVEGENSRGKNENADTSGRSNFRHLVNVYYTNKKNNFTVDHKPREDVQDNSDAEYESNNETQATKRRVVLKEAGSSEGESCSDCFSANQTSQSYLYERNPLLDRRFTRLIEQLVPLRKGIQAERKIAVRKEHLSDTCDEICFKDICLNDTCRLVFKIMNKGSSPLHDGMKKGL